MCRENDHLLRMARNLNAYFNDSALLAVIDVGKSMIAMFGDRKTRQNGIAVLTATKPDVVSKDNVHFRQFSQQLRLIDSVRSRDSLIHFLQCDDVGLHARNNGGDPLEIQFPVDSLAVMNVIG